MKKKTINFKNVRNAILFVFLNLSFSTYAINSIEVEFEGNTNAVSNVASGSSNGVDTYKTFTITIPFFSTTLNKLIFRSDYLSSNCLSATMINVNGVNSTYSTNPNLVLHKWYEISDLPLGNSWYTIKSLCNGIEIPYSKQLIKVIVVKEPAPTLNLTISSTCSKDKKGLYNGYIDLKASGNYTNASKIYIKTTNTANTCTTNSEIRLPHLSNNSNLANNTILNSGINNCNSNGTYTVQLYYRSTAANGGNIFYTIPSGDYGWNNYTFKKTFKMCLNPAVPIFQDFQLNRLINIYPNPANESITINVAEVEKIVSYTIYDSFGTIVNNIKKLNLESNIIKVDISELKKGIYIINVVTTTQNYQERFIKE